MLKKFVCLLIVLALLPVSCLGQVLSLGSEGAEVRALQEKLRELGFFQGEIDGQYGRQTADAVQAAQKELNKQGLNLSVDGAAGPQTLAALRDEKKIERLSVLRRGDSGRRVRELQTRLFDLKLLDGEIDGRFGPKTAEAVTVFQRALVRAGRRDIRVDGAADKATRAALAGSLADTDLIAPETFDETKPGSLEARHLYGRTAILVDMDTGRVLFDKDSAKKMYPASTTKMMTLLVALESIGMDKWITVPEAAARVPKDSSLVPVYPGEKMTAGDLMLGLIIRSGNDAANALAVLCAGSAERFVKNMNAKAAALGLENTHFVNAHGYHHAEHYTTARDLAKTAAVALKNEEFARIVSARTHTLPPQKGKEGLFIENKWELLDPESGDYYAGAYGVKSGFTRAAGFCYVGAARKNGRHLLAVVMNCRVRSQCWRDMKHLFDYGFSLK